MLNLKIDIPKNSTNKPRAYILSKALFVFFKGPFWKGLFGGEGKFALQNPFD